MNKFARVIRSPRTAVAALASFGAASSHAALPDGVSAAITTAGADAATVGGLVVVALAGLVLFNWLRKVIK